MNKTLKKTLSIILTVLMIVTSVPFALAADGHTHALSADGETVEFTEFTADITRISTEANYYLTEDIELTEALNINLEGTVNLCLNGHSITTTAKTSNQTVIMIFSGTLNLCDCQGGGYITSSEDLSLSGVFGVNDSEFNMYSGEFKGLGLAGLRGCENFNMYGGKISGCTTGVSDAKCFNMYGGEISGCDRAVYISSAEREFTMHGGKIINNETAGIAYAPIEVSDGVFTMNDGEIIGNKTNGWGTVYIRTNGSFIMNGGKISDNVGYGVCSYGNTTINAGEISGNTDAGIFVENTDTLTLKGGKITNNGSGIKAVNYVTAYLTGDGVQVTGNKDGDVSYYVSFEVSAQLTPEKTQIGMSASGKAFARPDGTNVTTLEGMEACFYGTDYIFQVVECDNGELYLIKYYPYIYENENGDYVVETPFIEGIAFMWIEDNKLLENETSATLSKDKIQPGNKYICLVLVDGVIEAELEKECPSLITHQPTAGEPYVELEDNTDATYQWYSIETNETEVTDENATPRDYDGEYASYDAEIGWIGAFTGDYYEGGYEANFFKIELEAGQTISLQADKAVGLIGIWAEDSGDWKDFYPDGTEVVSFTASYDDVYNVYACLEEGTHIRAYLGGATYTEIEGETAAELENPEIGKKYACEVTFADGTKEMSDAFEYVYAITHQPTEAEPYVELNDNTDASYQWYTVEGDGVEITDENAFGDWQSIGAPFNNSVYEDGKWIADTYNDLQYYFIVDLEAGDTINFEFASEVDVILFEINGEFDSAIAVGGTEYSITVEESGAYWLATLPVDYVRATIGDVEYTPIDGQTTATLTPEALGNYACEVTFADGTKEMSDSFEVTKLHDCDFSGEWKYDSKKHWKECTVDGCSKISEEAEHSFIDGNCDCGYTCPHENYTDGVCDNCEYACTHSWGEGVLTRPSYDIDDGEKEGYYTYTCEICGDEKTEAVESADTVLCDELFMQVFSYSVDETLTEEARDEIEQRYQNFKNNNSGILDKFGFIRNDLIASEQKIVDEAAAELQEIVDAIEAKIENGEYVKVDVKLNEILSEIIQKWSEKLEAEGLTDEYEDFINNNKATDEALAAEKEINDFAYSLEGSVADNAENLAKLEEMMNSLLSELENCLRGTHNFNNYEITTPAKCGENAIETGTCWLCGETDEREVEGSALKHSFTKYEEVTAPECGKAGLEKAICDNGCDATDEKEIPALEHIFVDYTSNGDATCEADGTKTAECIHGCGTTDTVTDEDSKLSHTDEDGDKLCDDCQAEIIDTCPHCGRPVHEGQINEFICLLIMFIRLVTSFVSAIS